MVRYKNRYFAVEAIPEDRPEHHPLVLNKRLIYREIEKKMIQMHGDYGWGVAVSSIAVKYCNPYTKIILIRCKHGPHRLVASILPLIRELEKVKVKLKVIYVGGTIIKCFKTVQLHQQKTLEKYWNKMNTTKDQLLFKEALADLTPMTSLKKELITDVSCCAADEFLQLIKKSEG